MSSIYWPPCHGQQGRYNSAEHESLRAVSRSLRVQFGLQRADSLVAGLLTFMGVGVFSDLSAPGANYCRKQLEGMLPHVAI